MIFATMKMQIRIIKSLIESSEAQIAALQSDLQYAIAAITALQEYLAQIESELHTYETPGRRIPSGLASFINKILKNGKLPPVLEKGYILNLRWISPDWESTFIRITRTNIWTKDQGLIAGSLDELVADHMITQLRDTFRQAAVPKSAWHQMITHVRQHYGEDTEAFIQDYIVMMTATINNIFPGSIKTEADIFAEEKARADARRDVTSQITDHTPQTDTAQSKRIPAGLAKLLEKILSRYAKLPQMMDFELMHAMRVPNRLDLEPYPYVKPDHKKIWEVKAGFLPELHELVSEHVIQCIRFTLISSAPPNSIWLKLKNLIQVRYATSGQPVDAFISDYTRMIENTIKFYNVPKN